MRAAKAVAELRKEAIDLVLTDGIDQYASIKTQITSSEGDIKEALREAKRLVHPDKNITARERATEAFKKLGVIEEFLFSESEIDRRITARAEAERIRVEAERVAMEAAARVKAEAEAERIRVEAERVAAEARATEAEARATAAEARAAAAEAAAREKDAPAAVMATAAEARATAAEAAAREKDVPAAVMAAVIAAATKAARAEVRRAKIITEAVEAFTLPSATPATRGGVVPRSAALSAGPLSVPYRPTGRGSLRGGDSTTSGAPPRESRPQPPRQAFLTPTE